MTALKKHEAEAVRKLQCAIAALDQGRMELALDYIKSGQRLMFGGGFAVREKLCRRRSADGDCPQAEKGE